VDSTGLSIVGEGEWAAAKHGRLRSTGGREARAAAKHGRKGKRGWRKLDLGVDGAGIIVAQVLTADHADDSAAVPDLLD
ncbi:MAG: hypothetical protein ACI82F_002971, partial [Planctomycetota bacterium]